MANLMITTDCNFSCPYCFGRDMIGTSHEKKHMEWDLFTTLIDWIKAGDIYDMDVHLMGGEPTLHPQFKEMIDYIISKNFRIVVFSNASTKINSDLCQQSSSRGISWVVNVNDPATYTSKQANLLDHNLKLLQDAASLTLNICNNKTKYKHIIDYTNKYNLSRHIKIGVSLPTMDKNNVFITFDDFKPVSEYLVQIAKDMAAENITIEFECGVPYCLFDDKQKKYFGDIKISHCGSRLDITPWGNLINCLPLVNFASVHYTNFSNYLIARNWFSEATLPYRRVGVNDQCFGCQNIANGNCGVCLAHGLDKYNRINLPPFPEIKAEA
ncbi:MAG: radical SAM protein [Spirochaetes bacterium]|nr:radical SAM protein [Spirochaetota bacterium]MBN2770142.1 radical SAM protein [Spirochaetota bacterium]